MNHENQQKTRQRIKEKPHYSFRQMYRLMGCDPNAGVDA